MSTIKQDWGTTAARTFLGSELDSLADATYTASEVAVDFGDPGPFGVVIEAKIAGVSSSCTGLVEFYMLWSADNTDFSDQSAVARNGTYVGAVDLNGTATAIGVFQAPVMARYGKLRAYNNSGAALASNAGDVVGTDVSYDVT